MELIQENWRQLSSTAKRGKLNFLPNSNCFLASRNDTILCITLMYTWLDCSRETAPF